MPGMNIIRALSSEGIFSYSSLHKHCCCFEIREFPQATSSYVFVCFLLHHLFITINLCLQVMDILSVAGKDNKGLYFLSKKKAILSKIVKCNSKIFQCAYF